MKTIQILALFMVLLVFSMPISFAAAINPEFIGGTAEISGILETTDSLQIRTAVDSETPVQQTNMLVTIFGITRVFNECTQVTSTEFFCTYTSEEMDKTAGSYPGTLKLTNTQQQIVAQYPFTITVDGLPPEIEELEIPEYFTNEINLNYAVQEKSCPTCAATACAGFKELQLKLDDDVVYTKALDVQGCALEETRTIATAALQSVEQGSYEACVAFVDNLGQSSEECRQVTVDLSAPALSPENVQLKNVYSAQLTHVADAPVQGYVEATIADFGSGGSGLNSNAVAADLSSLNSNVGEGYDNFPAACTSGEESTFTCTWSVTVDVDFEDPTESTTTQAGSLVKQLPITIHVVDLAGNSYEFTKAFELRKDVSQPVINDIVTLHPGFLNKENNTIIIEINEPPSDAGFENKQVFLDLNSFSLGMQQVDLCRQTGSTWECLLETFQIPNTVNSGRSGIIKIQSLKDDVERSYNPETSVTERSVQYDGEAPQVLNITLKPLGRNLEVIQQGDVVAITAYIEEKVSGLDQSTVLADFGAFNDGEQYAEASVCVNVDETNENIYECTWEYTGQLNPGTVRTSILAGDFAGNSRDSKSYGVYGTATVVQTQEYVTDFWQEQTTLPGLSPLNPNFLYFTQSGTLVRLNVELQRKQGQSYVHEFVVSECAAAVDLPRFNPSTSTSAGATADVNTELLGGNIQENVYLEASVAQQFYFPSQPRENKVVLVQVPGFFYGTRFNASIGNNITLDGMVNIVCQGEVTQGRTRFSNVYSPNEVINITATVPLMAGLYTEPGFATVQHIQRGQKFLDNLDKYVLSWMKVWVNWGTKICGTINTLRSTINSLGSIVAAIDVVLKKVGQGSLTEGLKKTFSGLSTQVEKIWKGGPYGEGCDPSTSALGVCPNPYGFPSLGLLCDTVLCEHCGDQWGSFFGLIKDRSFGLNKILGAAFSGSFAAGSAAGSGGAEASYIPASTAGVSDEDRPRVGGELQAEIMGGGVQAAPSPQENLVVALICWPPCITGIYGQLNVIKQIEIHYNTCLNIAAVKGEDLNQCEQFKQAQYCQQIVGGFFWNWFYRLGLAFLSQLAVGSAEKFLSGVFKCPAANDQAADVQPACHVFRSIEAITVAVVQVVNTVKMWENQIGQFKQWFNKSNNETQAETDERVGRVADEYIEQQRGASPY